MRAVILAAGRAERLRPLTDHRPKCLLEVGGRTLLSRMITAFAAAGLRCFTIVDGFQGYQLRAALLAEFPREWFTFVRNAAWQSTNNAYSLWLARRAAEPFLLADSDIAFDPAIVRRLLAADAPNRLALRRASDLGAEEVKVAVDETGRIRDIGKHLTPAEAAGESIGLELFSAEFAESLFQTLERRVIRQGRVDEWYEASFRDLIEAGHPVHPVDITDLRCIEIDTPDDLLRARELFPDSEPRSPAVLRC
jgi:choline kinase